MIVDRKNNKEIKKEKAKAFNFLGVDNENFAETNIKTTGKILGIDYGTKNIGLAISDRNQKQAFVYDTLRSTGKLYEQIRQLCEKEMVDKIVVGLPLGMKGEYTKKTDEVMYFIEMLEEMVKIMVVTEDERLTSVQAAKRNDGQGIDESSAQIILQQYLDKLK